MLTGDDVSSWQNVSQEAAFGHDFVSVKASQGTNYVNPLYAQQLAWARTNGRLVMHYHFNNMGPWQAEADYFLAHADIRAGELVSLDMENGALDAASAAWALQWMRYVDSKVTGTPVIYLNQAWARFMGVAQPGLRNYPLWIADYSTPAGAPHTCGWSVWTFQQYNDLPLDLDIFNGNAATWLALAGGSPPPPPPPGPAPYVPPKFMFTISCRVQNNYLTRMVQTRLISLGYHGTAVQPFVVDGVFGDQTAKWVGLFQSRCGLTSDGIVGPLTWAAIFA
jgi:lysozyme